MTNVLMIELENAEHGLGLEQLQGLPEVHSVEIRGNVLRLGVGDLSAGTPKILQWLVEHGHRIQHVASERADLETVFLTLTGRSLRDS